MADLTAIEWCDATLNLWWGCTKVSEGCKFCYAEHLADGRYQKSNWGPKGTRREVKSWRATLEKISKRAKAENRRLRVFCQSMSDTFEGPESCGGVESENWKTMTRLRGELWNAIFEHPELDFLILTKRPENIEYCIRGTDTSEGINVGFAFNVWLGTSVEDQKTAEERIPHLLKIPCPVRFLSCEPLLGPVDLADLVIDKTDSWERHLDCLSTEGLEPEDDADFGTNTIHWVICGGESGPNARPMHPDWARGLRDQCKAAKVPFLFKQWGEWVDEIHSEADPHSQQTSDAFVKLIENEQGQVVDYTGLYLCKAGKKKAGRILDGRTWDQFPEVNHG